MEGCPRSLMLKLDLKESHVTSFAPALKRYIRDFYHEDGETYAQECTQLEQLRTAVIKPTYDNSGCNLLRKYYGQIHLLKTRFPMGEGSPASVEFTWTDLYTEDPITLGDITYEQSSILFNLGALHSLLAGREDRVSEEGMKVACTHYQSAAGAFNYIKENFSTDQYSDTSKELLNLYINIMLGQAQECLLEKSMLDNRKNSLVARIAMQVQNYYTEAIACLTSSFGEILPPRMHKHWSKTLQIKCSYLNALAFMYMSNASDEQTKYGEKVAFLKIAAQKVADAQKLLKNQSQQMLDVVQFIADVVTQKLEGAKRDNDFVYHEPEPAPAALPEIIGASLVKPLPFQPYDPSMGKDIFEKLIPMKAHESSSLYSEEKANLLRRYASIVSEKDKELSSWLASMHIDDLMKPEEADALPPELTTKCESLQSNPGAIKKSTEMLAKLKEKGSELEKTLEETRKEIIDFQNEKTGFMEKYNVKLEEDKLKEYLEEIDSYQQKHLAAKKTNDELEKAFEAHRNNLELMIGPEQALQGIFPSQNILDSPIEDDAVQRIRDLLAKVEKMKTQRAEFMNKLRDQVNKDDITHLIATRDGGDLEDLFKEELKKHNESCELLQCNLDAQEKIMKALTEANAKYAHARRSVAEIQAKRDVVVKGLIGSFDFFMNFKEKVSSGVTFYNQLSEIFEKRRQEIASVCKSEKERLQNIIDKAKQIKEERERKSETKVDPTLSNTNPGERPNNPGNPQQSLPTGYPHQGHIPQLTHQPIPHSLRGPAPNQPAPMQSGHPAQFNAPPSSHPRGPSNQPGMSQYIPRVPSGTLLTTRPRMSYPHPPFPTNPQERPRPPTSGSWQPPPSSRPGDTSPPVTSNIRFPPPQNIRQPNIPQGPPQQFPNRPPLPMHTPQGYPQQYGQVPWQPQQNRPQFRAGAPEQSRPPPPQMMAQRPGRPQQPMMSHQPRPVGQPPIRQGPPSQVVPQGQHMLPQQPARPVTPPSPKRISQPYQAEPPSYQQQFGIGSNQAGPLQQPGHQPVQPTPYQTAHGQQQHGPLSHGQRADQYQQPQGQQGNQQPRTRQIPNPYQQPQIRMQQLPPQQQQIPKQPTLHQLPPQQLPPQPHQGVPPQQPPGPYHQHGAYQQRFPYQPQQQHGSSHQSTGGTHPQPGPQQPHQQGFQATTGPSPHQQGQYPTSTGPLPAIQQSQIPPVQQQPPIPYDQLTSSQVPHNFPQALASQSYQKQPLTQKHSSESLPQQRGPFQISKSREVGQQDKVPFQHERPGPPPAQQSYGNPPVHPVQSQITDKIPSNPAQDKQPHYSQRPEGQYLSQAPSGQQQTTQTGSCGPNKAPYVPQQQQQQQWQHQQQQQQQQQQQPWQQQYRPTSPPQHDQYPQTNKAVQDPGISKPGMYPSTSSHSIPSGFPHPSKPEGYLSPKGSRTDISATSTYPHSTTSQKDDLPPKPGVFSTQSTQPTASSYPQSGQQGGGPTPDTPRSGVTTVPSSQDTRPNMAYPQSTSSHSLTQHHTHQHPSDIQNLNPSHDTKGPYFPAVSSQASQSYSAKSQPTDSSSLTSRNLRSNSFQDFNPTKVVLAKPGALSVGPSSGNPSAITSAQDLSSVSTSETKTMKDSNTSNIGMIYSEVAPLDTTLSSGIKDPAGQSSGIYPSAPLSGSVQPKSSIDDKLMENLKSLDSPNALVPKQPGKSTKDEDIGTNDQESGSRDQGPSVSESHQPGGGSQGVASGQEDVHKLQQKVLLQQQQLIEQQQRFLEQQALGENSQVRKLMEQIKQQQKELDELRSEVKVREQFGEIERHLENLERRQNAVESRKTDAVSDEGGAGKPKVQTESGGEAISEEMQDEDKTNDKDMNEINTGATTSNVGGDVFEGTTKDQLSEITGGVEISKQEINDYFLMSQLSEFTSTSSQHDKGTLSPILTDNSASGQKHHETRSNTISDEPPPKPSRAPQAQPHITTSEKPETHPTASGSIPSTTDTLESNIASDVGTTPPSKDKEASPPRPIKHRPPPAIPEPYTPPTPPAFLTRDVFSKPASDAIRVDLQKPEDREEYILRLTDLVINYRDTVNNLTQRQARGPSILTKEWLAVQHYQDMVSQALTCDDGKRNTTKNRYLDILPYDQTRVHLEDREDSDYINATMVEDLTPLSPKYIASQGPIPQCFMDFWLMIWQQKCPLIVMLTKEVEGKKLKCHQYWPKHEGHSMLFGSLRVTMKRQTSLAFWKERLIHITHNETHELHVVEHYQFTCWPDHGVPSNPSDFFTFMGHIYIRHLVIDPDIKKPILLHCSAGVGRTGAFIVIYSAMREMYSGNGIMDVQTLVKKLREKRKYMVQKKEQYEFCYKAILHSAEQFLIIENSGNMADDDSSSDYSTSSSDSCSFLSDDEAELAMKPTVPQRPHISQKPREIPGNSSDGKQENKGQDSENLESRNELPSTSNSGERDPSSQTHEGFSEKSVDTSQKCDQSSEKSQNDSEKIEQGNTLNNFLEICKKSPPDNEILPEVINKDGVVPGGFQETDSVKVSTDENSGKESNSSEKSEMGETKYKEITEEPEEQIANGEITDSTNADCGTLGCESAAVIPGLQEIQGVVEDDNDKAVAGDDEAKSDVPSEKTDDKPQDTPVEEIVGEILEGATVDVEKGKASRVDDHVLECEALKTEISPGDEGDVISQQENGGIPTNYTPSKEINTKAEEEKDISLKQSTEEMPNDLGAGGETEQEIVLTEK
ncbi:tyrosine-protein phosphatase non-receptor type 23-like [Dendronephthya gigantea]|uniref:tyrosine-protein phosphatase non-receptor type 23-like n=1 Tax=Dendronephthya gigantea TaxID=151771 RepID=UPI00106D8915|nr:tyrosine-protein phosphatase non-receptor type 23-like [Dendronephthya gigantea]